VISITKYFTVKYYSWQTTVTGINLNVGKLNFGNRVCDDWNTRNRQPEWVVSGESVNEFKGILAIFSEIIDDLNKFCPLLNRLH